MEETRPDFPSKLFAKGTLRLLLFVGIVSGLVWLLSELWTLLAFALRESSPFPYTTSFDTIQAIGRVGYIFFQLSVWGIVVSTALTVRHYILERNSIGE